MLGCNPHTFARTVAIFLILHRLMTVKWRTPPNDFLLTPRRARKSTTTDRFSKSVTKAMLSGSPISGDLSGCQIVAILLQDAWSSSKRISDTSEGKQLKEVLENPSKCLSNFSFGHMKLNVSFSACSKNQNKQNIVMSCQQGHLCMDFNYMHEVSCNIIRWWYQGMVFFMLSLWYINKQVEFNGNLLSDSSMMQWKVWDDSLLIPSGLA